jgi:hypothetical protein
MHEGRRYRRMLEGEKLTNDCIYTDAPTHGYLYSCRYMNGHAIKPEWLLHDAHRFYMLETKTPKGNRVCHYLK